MELSHIPDWIFSGDGYGLGFGSGSGFGYGDGFGAGDGDGSGAGYGDGSGSGFGYGDGFGAGDGDGYGYGDGSGSGSGDGSGYGAGDGDGSGSGYGAGDGDGSGYGYWYILGQRYVEQAPCDSVLAFWRSDEKGQAANGGHSSPVHVGLRQSINGSLSICNRGLHATMNPGKWNGERLWVVALHGEFQQSGDKFAALEREIIAEIPLT